MKSGAERKPPPPPPPPPAGREAAKCLASPSNTVLNAYCCAPGNIADIRLEGPRSYTKQTMPSNFMKWYNDHFARGQNSISSRDAVFEAASALQRESGGGVHKSFLPGLRFSFCLSSKHRNPCQSCCHGGFNVIQKTGSGRDHRTSSQVSTAAVVLLF